MHSEPRTQRSGVSGCGEGARGAYFARRLAACAVRCGRFALPRPPCETGTGSAKSCDARFAKVGSSVKLPKLPRKTMIGGAKMAQMWVVAVSHYGNDAFDVGDIAKTVRERISCARGNATCAVETISCAIGRIKTSRGTDFWAARWQPALSTGRPAHSSRFPAPWTGEN